MKRHTTQAKYDLILTEYVNSTLSLQELAEKHDVTYGRLRNVAGKQKWSMQRADQSKKVTEAAKAASIFDRVEELRRSNEDDLRMAKALRGLAAQMINNSQQPGARKLSLGELGQAAKVVADAQKIARLALGASTENSELSGPDQGPIKVADVSIEAFLEARAKAIKDF